MVLLFIILFALLWATPSSCHFNVPQGQLCHVALESKKWSTCGPLEGAVLQLPVSLVISSPNSKAYGGTEISLSTLKHSRKLRWWYQIIICYNLLLLPGKLIKGLLIWVFLILSLVIPSWTGNNLRERGSICLIFMPHDYCLLIWLGTHLAHNVKRKRNDSEFLKSVA